MTANLRRLLPALIILFIERNYQYDTILPESHKWWGKYSHFRFNDRLVKVLSITGHAENIFDFLLIIRSIHIDTDRNIAKQRIKIFSVIIQFVSLSLSVTYNHCENFKRPSRPSSKHPKHHAAHYYPHYPLYPWKNIRNDEIVLSHERVYYTFARLHRQVQSVFWSYKKGKREKVNKEKVNKEKVNKEKVKEGKIYPYPLLSLPVISFGVHVILSLEYPTSLAIFVVLCVFFVLRILSYRTPL